MRRLLLPCLLLAASGAIAQPAQPLTLAQVMADPDWIGPPVEQAWWRWDGKAAQYTLKREGASIRDTWQQALDGNGAKVGDAERANLDAADPAYDAGGARMAFVRNGDVFVRDLRNGALTQLTRSNDDESRLQWSSDGALVWRGDGETWFRWNGSVVSQAAQLKAEDSPDAPPADDSLRDRQLRLMRTLADDKAQRDAERTQNDAWRRADPSRAPAPLYLGKDVDIVDSSLSPDGRWLLAVTTEKGADAGKVGQLQKFITESGYEEPEEERTRVGRNDPLPQKLWLADVATGTIRELKFDPLPGIATDPLAALRKAAGKDALKGNRPLLVMDSRWSGDSRNVAVMLRAIDNKDRWLATITPAGVDLAKAKLQPRHRLHDEAWINWNFNEFGWLPDNRTLWYLSEESGFSHLYALDGAKRTQLTDGKWETSQVEVSRDGRGFYFLCNRDSPVDYEVCRVPASGGAVQEVTSYDGVESFELPSGAEVKSFVQSPDGAKLLVRHSSAYLPPQLAVVDANGGNARELTDTRSAAFKAIDWIVPESVQVPSKHGAGTIWGKYYGPAHPQPGRKYPIVMFVHGAGYLQNADLRWPDYFREQMFHNLLVQQGFVVLDLDYRASEGYGRDWRTAIYRWMGKPELEDYLDGLDWAIANKQADRERAGIYGGSYGGFMTFVALFKQPGVFKAGAALRPVSDWTQYNHEYTSNILNTPDIDPEAYNRSSPIEYAAGLRDRLLIAHGMIDDNVLFKDSVDMTQKLIELRKTGWSIAPYPTERHGFTHPDAWYDEYRRIDELFLETLEP